MVHLRTLSLSQTVRRLVVRRMVAEEMRKMPKDVIFGFFKVLSRHSRLVGRWKFWKNLPYC